VADNGLGDLIQAFLIERDGSDIGTGTGIGEPQISAPIPCDPPVTQARLP